MSLKISSHRKLKLLDKIFLDGTDIILLIEYEHDFLIFIFKGIHRSKRKGIS